MPLRIIRCLFEHKLALLIVLALLVGQAAAELSIPRLTSNIVDVGIQQSGVEHAALDEMSASTYDTVAMVLPAEQERLVADSYDELPDGVYVLNDRGRSSRATLDAIMAGPLAFAYGDEQTKWGDVGRMRAAYGAGDASKDAVVEEYESFAARSGADLLAQQGIAAARAECEALGIDLPAKQMSYLLRVGSIMLIMAAASAGLSILVGLVATRTGARIGYDLRRRLFTRVMSFSEAEISRFSTASLITRGTNDVQLIQNVAVMLMRMVLYAPILALGGIVMVALTSPSMGWIVAAAVAAVFVLVAVLFKLAMPKFKIMQQLIDRVNLVAREMLTGMPVVRAFGREDVEQERFDEASSRLMKTQVFANRVMTFIMPAMMLIMNVTSVAIVWVGGLHIDAGSIQTGDMIAFISYSSVIVMGFLMIGMISIMLPRADVAAARIDEVLATEPSIADPERRGCEEASATEGEAVDSKASGRGARVVFDDVSFRYDESSECVLEHVSFAVEPGQMLAVVGATGSGKSTVLKLIERFYDVSDGAVLLDGVDVRSLPLDTLRAQIGYVPQRSFLFEGTIAENVAYGMDEADEGRIRRALEIAQAGFVDDMPEGLDTGMSQGGSNVSGGQRQRLAIARALAGDARLLLFDDSFSALDYRTDAELRRALDKELRGVTRIVVAQRIATVLGADRIVVLDDGSVAGVGSHAELMENCEAYREIAFSQLSPEELSGRGGAA